MIRVKILGAIFQKDVNCIYYELDAIRGDENDI